MSSVGQDRRESKSSSRTIRHEAAISRVPSSSGTSMLNLSGAQSQSIPPCPSSDSSRATQEATSFSRHQHSVSDTRIRARRAPEPEDGWDKYYEEALQEIADQVAKEREELRLATGGVHLPMVSDFDEYSIFLARSTLAEVRRFYPVTDRAGLLDASRPQAEAGIARFSSLQLRADLALRAKREFERDLMAQRKQLVKMYKRDKIEPLEARAEALKAQMSLVDGKEDRRCL